MARKTKFEIEFRAWMAKEPVESANLALAMIRGEREPTELGSVARFRDSCYGEPDRHQLLMMALDELCRTHGVEHLGEVHLHDGPPLEYLNTGDPYGLTLLWFRDFARPWRMGCWGDYVDRFPTDR